jgi:hypothetical protein
MFRDKDYFKEKAGITQAGYLDAVKHEAAVALNFQPFPIAKWPQEDITDDHIFDMLEFLYDRVSEPGEMVNKTSETGWNFSDYDSYDSEMGQKEFRDNANAFLSEYKTGFELTKEGTILAMGVDGLQHIVDAEIIPYDERNVDSKVRNAIAKWRNRNLSLSEKKEAIRELADVFEWLKRPRALPQYWMGRMNRRFLTSLITLVYVTTIQNRKRTTTPQFGIHGFSISTWRHTMPSFDC